jgi:hypothetical protein
MARVESLEKNVAGHEQTFSLQIEQLQHDMRFLALALGVELPSQEPKEAPARIYTDDHRAARIARRGED